MSKHLPQLVKFAQELPSLQYDLQNASTIYNLRDVSSRLFNIVSYMLHDVILDAYASMTPAEASAAASRALPASAPSPLHAPVPAQATGVLPQPPTITGPSLGMPSIPGIPDGIVATPGAMNVVVTPQGTRVMAPGATQPVVLPPGAPVDLASVTGQPELPDAAPGVAQVVLPPGGGMTAELAAALASRAAAPSTEPVPGTGG